MVIAWIGYCLLVSALLGVAALAAERGLGHYRKPVRGVWIAALVGSLLLPIAAYVVPTLVERLSPMPQGVVIPLGAIGAPGVSAEAGGFDWAALVAVAESLAAWLWIGSVLALGGYLFGAYRGLRREMGGWTPGKVLGAPVMMSKDRGPAVVGLRRGVIVMPAWIADLEEDLLRLVFLHEREHQKAGDQRLFALGLAAAIAMPWNPIVWWQLRRLRLAIEYDCDRRVVSRGISRRDYAEALLAVGSRVSRGPLAAAGFAERRPAVERRLRRLSEPLRRLRGARAAVAAGVGTLALILACGSPLPTESEADAETGAQASGAVADALDPSSADNLPPPPQGGTAADRPAFLPYDKRPELQNGRDIQRALQEAYPAEIRAAGRGGRVEVWMFITEEGEVGNYQLKTSSGDTRLDEAALEVAREMRFTPALNRDQRTAVWVSQWFTFEAGPRLDDPAEPGGSESYGLADAEAALSGAIQEVRGEPLLIVDGVIRPEASMSDFGENEIEMIEIIKGETAVTRYGARAANGAILVSTVEARLRAGEKAHPLPEDAPTAAELEERTGIEDFAARDYLVIVDGVIQLHNATLSDLRRLDIDHIEIIKGEAAVARYGERARNGVISVTTKEASVQGRAEPGGGAESRGGPAQGGILRQPAVDIEYVPRAEDQDPSSRPIHIPYDQRPVLENVAEVQRALQDAYPDDLKSKGIGGRVEVWLYVTETGVIGNREVKTASGNSKLDQAALEVAAAMRFTPARYEDRPTGVWISQWITFEIL